MSSFKKNTLMQTCNITNTILNVFWRLYLINRIKLFLYKFSFAICNLKYRLTHHFK